MLDYIYVTYWQLTTFLVRTNPDRYLITPAHTHPTKIPVVLIPGIYENWRFMKPVADLLHKEGHPVHVIDALHYNLGEIEEMSELVSAYITQSKLKKCIIVAHSKGALVGKYLLTHHNRTGAIKGIIALNAPFSGSRYANFIPLKSTRLFVPNSVILSMLATRTSVNNKIVSIYGLFDPHIPEGSYLDGARNIQLSTRGHFKVMNSPQVHQAILEAIPHVAYDV